MRITGVFNRMQQKQLAGLFIEIFAVVAILGALAAVALPFVGRMIDSSKDQARETELQNIQTAVTEMLADSVTGKLVPAGPTADMSHVMTTDTPPLVLEDYLLNYNGEALETGSTYLFSSEGQVRQLAP